VLEVGCATSPPHRGYSLAPERRFKRGVLKVRIVAGDVAVGVSEA